MSQSNDNVCMAHGCTKSLEGGARGLCMTHYKMLLREVDKGTYTWAYLEQIGACKPSAVIRNPEDKAILASFLTNQIKNHENTANPEAEEQEEQEQEDHDTVEIA